MPVQAIHLHNFRGFADARLELKPLTVLLGPNSAGKSSFGHALAALAHTHARYRGAGYFETSLTPRIRAQSKEWPIDLGGLNDLRTVGSSGRVEISVETTHGHIKWGFGLESETDALLLSHLEYPDEAVTPGSAPRAHSPVTVPSQSTTTTGEVRGQIAQITGNRMLSRINRQQWRDELSGDEIRVDMDGLLLRGIAKPTGTSISFDALAGRDIDTLLTTLCYLRAVRERPARVYEATTGDWQNIGYGGEYAAAILKEHFGTPLATPVLKLPPVPTTFEQAASSLDASGDRWKTELGPAVAYWFSRMHLLTSISSTELPDDPKTLRLTATLEHQQPHDITEIGLGVSQVLPVLVAGLLQPSNSLFIVDLPEAHLHPLPQGDLADFFCSMALTNRHSLIETHSENFFHRLRLRAELDQHLKKQIAVYFVDPPSDGRCSEPRPVGLGLEDQIRWPADFMEEILDSEMKLATIRAARKASR